MEIHPTLLKIAPFDTTIGTSVYFTYTGSKQAIVNELVITDTSDNAIVYMFEFSSFEKIHPIPPRILSNGKIYKAKLRVKFKDETYSPYSQDVEFRTFKRPILDINNIDGQGHVYNQDVTFIATYSQAENERVKTYRFSLYDENEDLITNYPIREPMSPNELTEVVHGLEKGKGYFIECSIETVNGVTLSHRERFVPMYVVPSANGLITPRNDSEEGFIRITTNLKQIIGTQVKAIENDDYHSDNYDYIDNEMVIVPKNNPLIFRGLDMNKASDFVMKIWCRNIPYDTKFLELSPSGDSGISIDFWRYKDRVVAVKEYKGVKSRHRSNIYVIPKNVDFMLYVRAIEHRLDLSLKIV